MTTQKCSNQQFQKASPECLETLEEKSLEIHGISQEMTMMQQKSELTSLSSSSKIDIENEQQNLDAQDDPDFVMTGKMKSQQNTKTNTIEDDELLSYWDTLKNQTSSVWDLLSGDPLDGVDQSEVLQKTKPKIPNLRPYISFNDLNNSKDARNINKPKPAIEIGIAFDF